MFEISNLFCLYVFILFNLYVTSFNCHGIGTSIETIRQLTTEFEIVFLEETWIYPDEFAIVSQIRDEMQSFSLSSMSLDEKLLSGSRRVSRGGSPRGLAPPLEIKKPKKEKKKKKDHQSKY